MSAKAKVLIVEDDASIAFVMAYLLEQADCETEMAKTGERAMQMAEESCFDLITLDVDLPDISGFEVCRRLKENPLFQTPIVFCSGRPSAENIQRGLELGAMDFIPKPFETFEFTPRLLSHIRREQEATVVGFTSE